ncbi:TAXI family TRAP transporter solute-binding subunit [Scytonema hofmannii FACHB-248]|uniref:TAXI family TRAP transporter solute-binding subunit n=1 Tax=Scytonema hofmannii FACHB-248 TaxID=1842502 RepID=A0ABR8GQ61_9CYAN|nr:MULTISPECIES: TAXI family TRAP transporter solute-binding subunit [Nostocales]MBD2605091.1 TAXI family TRAP transporter solute-binding subunit [Scytonema hofmannii FACHB-248]
MTVKINFLSFFRNLDPLSKFIFICLGFASLSLVVLTTYHNFRVQGLMSSTLTLAAGDPEGESYIISEAIEKVVERNSSIKIEVISTGGTTESLKKLQEGTAQLATAQADVAPEEISGTKAQSSRTVAILYKDLFQLVVRDPNIKQFSDLRGKRVSLPIKGGQYKSFDKVAQHYGLLKEDKKTLDIKVTGLSNNENYDDKQAEEDFKSRTVDALFRVRALGNQGISTLVKDYDARLVPIEQAKAMKIQHPAFESAEIPQGAYKGNFAVPDKDLPTVAVSRILVVRDTVDASVIQEITRIIFEHRQEIANTVSKEHPEVKPLIASIDRPSNTSGSIPPIHPGAVAFYERDKPSFVQEHADYLALILTVIVVIVSWIRQLKIWIESSRKNEADEYIASAINLMKASPKDLDSNQKQLDEIFRKAADALILESISQESFRTFNEAYKTTREAIEREKQFIEQQIEDKQREISAKYIKAIVELLHDTKETKGVLQQKIDGILKEVADKLILEEISQESFRTFIEAYKTTRDAIERH